MKKQKGMDNKNQPISPQMFTRVGDGDNDFEPIKDGHKTGYERKFSGLTKREYFAGLAMQSYFGGEFTGQSGMPYDTIAKNCVAMADALLKELEVSND